ncbi:unnamed protein product [Meloidogyne enterolobii]|uniref:Uncharacterized protein n=1 Tax=Meloidogyne enterolobii TaxID=390850 RepID=A0ACB0YPJ1_MELEN
MWEYISVCRWFAACRSSLPKMKSGAAKTKSSEGKTKGDEQQQPQQQQKKSASSVKSSGSKDSLPANNEDSDLVFSSVSQASVIEREPTKPSTPVTPPMQSRPLPVANLSMTETVNSDSVSPNDDDKKSDQRKRQGVASIWKLPKGADVNKDPRSSNYS